MIAWLRPASPQIERLRNADRASSLSRLHASAFAHPWDVAAFEAMLCEKATVAHALVARGDALGFILSRRVLDEAEILTVVVAGSARGKGNGARLLTAHLSALAGEGVRTIHLEVEDGNAPAHALYRRLGFEPIGRREGYYLRPDGTRAGAMTMRRILD